MATETESLAAAVEWADANPVAYHIVTAKKSVFGRDSCEYMGLHRDGTDNESVLHRIEHLRLETLKPGIFGWRARFTVETNRSAVSTATSFGLWDGAYFRSSLQLDRQARRSRRSSTSFVAWCDPYYAKAEVRVGDRVGRRLRPRRRRLPSRPSKKKWTRCRERPADPKSQSESRRLARRTLADILNHARRPGFTAHVCTGFDARMLCTTCGRDGHREPDVVTLFVTMYDGRTRLATQVADDVRTHFRELVLHTIIPRSVRVSEAPSYAQSVITYDPSSSGAVAYAEAARELAYRAIIA